MLEVLVERTLRFGQRFDLTTLADLQAFIETFEGTNLGFIGKYLVERGFAEDKTLNYTFSVTCGGFARVEARRQIGASSSQAFVAMWFNPELDPIWEKGFAEGVRRAGYGPLRCSLKINFLRQEPPVANLSGRRHRQSDKTLLDSLSIPEHDEQVIGTSSPVYCLLEDDSLVAGLMYKLNDYSGKQTRASTTCIF